MTGMLACYRLKKCQCCVFGAKCTNQLKIKLSTFHIGGGSGEVA